MDVSSPNIDHNYLSSCEGRAGPRACGAKRRRCLCSRQLCSFYLRLSPPAEPPLCPHLWWMIAVGSFPGSGSLRPVTEGSLSFCCGLAPCKRQSVEWAASDKGGKVEGMHRCSPQKLARSGVPLPGSRAGRLCSAWAGDRMLNDGPSLHSVERGVGEQQQTAPAGVHVPFLLQEGTLQKLRFCALSRCCLGAHWSSCEGVSRGCPVPLCSGASKAQTRGPWADLRTQHNS